MDIEHDNSSRERVNGTRNLMIKIEPINSLLLSDDGAIISNSISHAKIIRLK